MLLEKTLKILDVLKNNIPNEKRSEITKILNELIVIIPNEKRQELTKIIKIINENMKIYRLVCNKTGLVYIGHTKLSLKQRLCLHISSYKRKTQGKIKDNTTSFQIIKNGNYDIYEIKKCPENEKEINEGHHIKNTDCVNKIIPGQISNMSYEEYKKSQKEKGIRVRSENEFNKIKYKCKCGSNISVCGKGKHFKTKKHIKFIENNTC